MYKRTYPNLADFEMISKYDLDDFKKYYKEGRYILVPRIRTDKTILVTKKG